MKPAPFRYARPETLEEVVALLESFRENAALIAGGQSLLPMLNMRLRRPKVLIDVALVAELQVLERKQDELVIGAGVRQRTAETSAVVRDACPLMALALPYVGHVQTRHRGTIGGSLAYADPDAELPGVVVALDARLVAVGPQGRRIIRGGDFFLGPYATALGESEVLTEVRLPVRTDRRYAYLEVGHRSRDFPITGVAAAVRVQNRLVAHARLVVIGVGGTPLRLISAEEAARNSSLGAAERARIAAAGVEDVELPDRTRGDAAHRRRIVRTLVSRALAEIAA